MIYTGVNEAERAKAGVEFIITNTRIKEVQKFQGQSEIILIVELKTKK